MERFGHNSGHLDPEQYAIAQSWLAATAPKSTVTETGRRLVDFGAPKSREVLVDAILTDPRADLSHIKVLWQFVRHTNNKSGQSWPTPETIAARTGLTLKTVRNRIYELLAWSYLERSGRGSDARYAIRPPGGMTFQQLEHIMSDIDELARVRQQLLGLNDARATSLSRRRAA